MYYRKERDKYILYMKKGEFVTDSLKKFAKEVEIQGGAILGIGAISDPTLSYFNARTKEYLSKSFNGKYELLSCIGNFSFKEEKIFPHIHAVLGSNKFETIGGHLTDCIVEVTAEFFIFPSKKIERKFDEKIGLFLWDLE